MCVCVCIALQIVEWLSYGKDGDNAGKDCLIILDECHVSKSGAYSSHHSQPAQQGPITAVTTHSLHSSHDQMNARDCEVCGRGQVAEVCVCVL